MKSNSFERFYKTDVTIANLKVDDYSGETEKEILGTLKADIQPYSGDKAREKYGIEIECQKRMFCSHNPNVDEKNNVIIGDEVYEIVHVAEWEFGLEVMLSRRRLR